MVTQSFNPSIKKRIKGFDELRGIAVIFVLLAHAHTLLRLDVLRIIGSVGVNIFFIISGYLITLILLKRRENENYFREFYVRRVFRILPLSLLFIIAGIILSIILNRNYKNVLIYYLTFTQNFIPITFGIPEDSTAFSGYLYGCSIMWTLAIEEQFYLFLPMIIRFIKKEYLKHTAILICFASLILRVFFLNNSAYTSQINVLYTNLKETWFHVHYLGIGVLLALPERKKSIYIVVLFWITIQYLISTPQNGLLEIPVLAIILYAVDRCIKGNPIFENEHLAHIGKLCFGIYLFHWPLIRFIEKIVIPRAPQHYFIPIFFVFLVITYLVSWLSFHYFEIPIQNLRAKFE